LGDYDFNWCQGPMMFDSVSTAPKRCANAWGFFQCSASRSGPS
jgi:hypothetical protein